LFRIGDPLRVQAVCEDGRQRRLADSYGPFDCDVPGKIKKLGHESGYEGKIAFENIPSARGAQLRKKLTLALSHQVSGKPSAKEQ
jgi:hypothetical protein